MMKLSFASPEKSKRDIQKSPPLADIAPLIQNAALQSARQGNQPIPVTVPFQGQTYYEVTRGAISCPANPKLNLVVINATAEVKKTGSKKSSLGQALSDVGIEPVFVDGGGGAIFVLKNDQRGGYLYAKALMNVFAQPLFGTDPALIPRRVSQGFLEGFKKAYNGNSGINFFAGLITLLSVAGGASNLKPRHKVPMDLPKNNSWQLQNNNRRFNFDKKANNLLSQTNQVRFSGGPLQKLAQRLQKNNSHLDDYPKAWTIFNQSLRRLQEVAPFPPGRKEQVIQITRPSTSIEKNYKSISQKINKKIKEGSKDIRQPDPQSIAKSSPDQYIDELYQGAISNQPKYETFVKNLAQETGGKESMRPGLKDRDRVNNKIKTEFNGDPRQVNDLLAGRISFNSIKQIYDALLKIYNNPKIEIVRYDDRFLKPQMSGYRDIILKLKLEDGHVAELRLELNPILKYSKEVEHPLYQVIRDIKTNAHRENRSLTSDEVFFINSLTQKTQADYEKILWDSGPKRNPSK